MYLKSLELHGFKSFPDRTLLKFNNGTTVIVGPNGSGKSNITDAMRWVLGELSSKNIRGSKMEDVIFAGADDKKPMSFAEVSVTFDDSEEPRSLQSPYDEVTVTRRYYRSGDSEYFINRKKCRLRDIYELFMNTGIGREGYSIIGQGRIAEIISKKSDDRRGVFEESAGISKYRYKKTASEKRLAETEANMERVADIEHELAMRIGPLEKDADKARRYLELYGEKKKTDVSLWLYDSVRLRNAIEKTEKDTKLSAHELAMAEDSIRVISDQIERLYEQSQSNKEASRRNYDETTAMNKRMANAEAESRLLLKESSHAENSIRSSLILAENAENAANQESIRLAEAEKRLAEIDTGIGEEQKQYEALTLRLQELDSRIRQRNGELDALLREKEAAENDLTDRRVRLNVLENTISDQKKRNESIQSEIRKYEEEIKSLDKTAGAALAQIEDYRKVISEIDEQNAEAQKMAESLGATFEEADEEVRRKQAIVDSLDSRMNALLRMQEHFDGYNNSTKHVMSEAKAGRLSGIRGPLSYLIKVEGRYVNAIETSLGGALQNIVTDDENATKRAIESLKQNNAGRATFYPLTTIHAQERGRDYDGLEKSRGFIGWADELVSCDHTYRTIVKYLLGRVVVYDTLDNATDAARSKGWRIRAVTLDGQQINAGGSFTGGQQKRDSGMLSRSLQIAELRSQRDQAALEMEDVQKKLNELKEKINSSAEQMRSATERKSLIDALIQAENKNFSDADGRRNALLELKESLIRDGRALDENSRNSGDDLAKMKEKIEEQGALVRSITEKREDLATLRGEDELLAAEVSEQSAGVRIRLAELTRDKEAAQISLRETTERRDAYLADAERHKENARSLQEKIQSLADTALEKEKEAADYKEQIEKLTGNQRKLEATVDEIDARISELRKTEKELAAKKDLVNTAHAKNENKLENLKNDDQKLSAKMWEDYEMTYASAVNFARENSCHTIEDGERTSFVAQQTELRNKIRGLGHVNVEAIDEYAEVKKRYEYITAQLNDLRASKEDLEKIIADIEGDMKTMFLDAFGKINGYFGEVFRELFGGGHAEVILTDPENALESGIEINAAPPGKTIKNLNLLSGGEQSIIAIALLFALIRFNPSPFCIFDEIEAALDEVNVTRVARYVKNYSREMQIIMISHRRGTMEVADSLYGVTMQQSGVSKVFTGINADVEKLLK